MNCYKINQLNPQLVRKPWKLTTRESIFSDTRPDSGVTGVSSPVEENSSNLAFLNALISENLSIRSELSFTGAHRVKPNKSKKRKRDCVENGTLTMTGKL